MAPKRTHHVRRHPSKRMRRSTPDTETDTTTTEEDVSDHRPLPVFLNPVPGPDRAELLRAHTQAQVLTDQLRQSEARLEEYRRRLANELDQRDTLVHRTEEELRMQKEEHTTHIRELMEHAKQLANQLRQVTDRETVLRTEAQQHLDYISDRVRQLENERAELRDQTLPQYAERVLRLDAELNAAMRERATYQMNIEEFIRRTEADHQAQLERVRSAAAASRQATVDVQM